MPPRQLFIRKNGVILGPFPFQQLEAMPLAPDDALSPDKTEWRPASAYFPKLAPTVQAIPEPPTPEPTTPEPSPELPPEPGLGDACLDEEAVEPPDCDVLQTAQHPDLPAYTPQPRLWLPCHLICAVCAWQNHLPALQAKFRAALWSVIAYALLAGLIPAALFAPYYPALHFSRLHGCGVMLIALFLAAAAAFLTIAQCLRAAHSKDWRTGSLAALLLLALCATAFGAATALVQVLLHPHPMARMAAMLLLLCTNALFTVGGRQLLAAFGHHTLELPRKPIRRHWLLWLFEALLLSSALALFLV